MLTVARPPYIASQQMLALVCGWSPAKVGTQVNKFEPVPDV